MSWARRLATLASLLVLVLGGLFAVDLLSALPSRVPRAALADAASSATGRAFVLVIDSLRYQTAVSPALMPHLSALRARSVFARVTPTRDAVTVPCLRAAFTGRDRTRVFGFVTNFFKGNAGLESIFTQLAQHGRSAAVYSDGAFDQFGDRGLVRASNGDPVAQGGESEDRRDHVDEQNATMPVALADYRAGKHDLVVMHVTYTDHVAHEVGIDAPLYAQRYRTADALVEQLDRELPASDTFVVMGDHGHDPQGRHAVGLDVPTYASYRGPRFVAGTDLGTVAIRDHRYWLGFALGLSLPDDYGGERHPQALRAGPNGLGSYAAAVGEHARVSPGVPRERNGVYVLVAFALAGLFALWLRLTAAGLAPRRDAASPVIAHSPLGRAAHWILPLMAAAAIWAEGVAFPGVRHFVHEPTYTTLIVAWLGLWTAAVVTTWRTRGLGFGSLLLSVPLFVLVPTVYRYGAPAAMAPAWIGWLVCVGASMLALRQRPPLMAAMGSLLLLAPFALVESSDFRFDEWILWPPASLPYGFLLLAMLAKLIVFLPRRATLREGLVGVLSLLLLTATQLGMVADKLQLFIAVALFAAAAWLRRRSSMLATLACVSALLLLHHYTIRLPTSAYYWQDCLLAALVLSARVVGTLPAPTRDHARAMLLLFACFVSGWVSFAWTLHRLEWRFLYDFWSAAFVESHVAMFLPLLIGRFALPLLAARVLLARELQEPGARALGLAWLLAGSKVASLMFWSYGIAFVSVASDVYLEAVQETCLACALLVGLL